MKLSHTQDDCVLLKRCEIFPLLCHLKECYMDVRWMTEDFLLLFGFFLETSDVHRNKIVVFFKFSSFKISFKLIFKKIRNKKALKSIKQKGVVLLIFVYGAIKKLIQ